MVLINLKEDPFREGAEWLNVYDPTDPVARGFLILIREAVLAQGTECWSLITFLAAHRRRAGQPYLLL